MTLLSLSTQDIQVIGLVVTFVTAIVSIYFVRKAKPIEKLNTELSFLQSHNDILEAKNDELTSNEEKSKAIINDLSSQINTLKEENKDIRLRLSAAEETIRKQEALLVDMKSQVITSQVSANLMRTQVAAIAKQFGLASTVRELDRRR